MADYNLTTLTAVRQYLEDESADERLLTALIARATGEIEHFCQRQFVSRAYADWFDGQGGHDTLLQPFSGFVQWPDNANYRPFWLPQYPVTAIRRICVDLRDGMTLRNDSTDCAFAVAMLSSTVLYLQVTGGANADQTSLDLDTYDTIATLAAAVNALGKGWVATVAAGASAWPSTELRPVMSAGCTRQAQTFSCPGLPVADVQVDADSGRLDRAAGWPQGSKNIFIDYTAGYTTVPPELEQTCIELVKRYYDQIEQDTNLKSESLDGRSWSAKSQLEKDDDLQSALQPHRRIIL